jgi:hypothetical protein
MSVCLVPQQSVFNHLTATTIISKNIDGSEDCLQQKNKKYSK